jgi:tRNA(Ile)-lysidine synthase
MPKRSATSALIAVSGGLDSTCLLFALASNLKDSQLQPTNKITSLVHNFIQTTKLNKLEVAYLDHAQRPDTNLDLKSVQKICTKFNIKLNLQELDLPPNCSEEAARQARYQALNLILKKRGLDHLITAHHADDVLETALINLKRGSGVRGLTSLAHHQAGIWRPFLSQIEQGVFITKQDLLNYAKLNRLTWHEDSTNQSPKYFRNRLRTKLKDSNPHTKQELLSLIAQTTKLNSNLQAELQKLELALRFKTDQPNLYQRSLFLSLAPKTQQHFIHLKLSRLGYDVNQSSVTRATQFIKAAQTKKTLQLKGCHITIPQKDIFLFQPVSRDDIIST